LDGIIHQIAGNRKAGLEPDDRSPENEVKCPRAKPGPATLSRAQGSERPPETTRWAHRPASGRLDAFDKLPAKRHNLR